MNLKMPHDLNHNKRRCHRWLQRRRRQRMGPKKWNEEFMVCWTPNDRNSINRDTEMPNAFTLCSMFDSQPILFLDEMVVLYSLRFTMIKCCFAFFYYPSRPFFLIFFFSPCSSIYYSFAPFFCNVTIFFFCIRYWPFVLCVAKFKQFVNICSCYSLVLYSRSVIQRFTAYCLDSKQNR